MEKSRFRWSGPRRIFLPQLPKSVPLKRGVGPANAAGLIYPLRRSSIFPDVFHGAPVQFAKPPPPYIEPPRESLTENCFPEWNNRIPDMLPRETIKRSERGPSLRLGVLYMRLKT